MHQFNNDHKPAVEALTKSYFSALYGSCQSELQGVGITVDDENLDRVRDMCATVIRLYQPILKKTMVPATTDYKYLWFCLGQRLYRAHKRLPISDRAKMGCGITMPRDATLELLKVADRTRPETAFEQRGTKYVLIFNFELSE